MPLSLLLLLLARSHCRGGGVGYSILHPGELDFGLTQGVIIASVGEAGRLYFSQIYIAVGPNDKNDLLHFNLKIGHLVATLL